MSRLRITLGGLVVLGIAGATGYLAGISHRPPRPALSEPAESRSQGRVIWQAESSAGLSLAAIRHAIRDELGTLREERRHGGSDVEEPIRYDDAFGLEPERAVPRRTGEQEDGFRRALELVAEAAASGSLGEEDAAELRQQFHMLDRDDQEAIVSELLPAVNAGRIRVEGHGPIF